MPIEIRSLRSSVTLAVVVVLGALAAATVLVAAIEYTLGVDDASSVYLLAVVAVAIWLGTAPAVATAIGAFLAYNFLFVDPRYTFTVARPEELLNLFLLLFVGIVMGRLAGLQRDRERVALRREREAQALFGISRELASSERLPVAMQAVVARLAKEAGMARTWVGIGTTITQERIVADSGGLATARPPIGTHTVLQRDREEGAANWTRIHPSAPPAGSAAATGSRSRARLFRVELRAADETVGSLWSERAGSAGEPHLEETRLLAAAADQLGQAVRRERLQAQAAELEIARRSDELKSALLDSVSHDLRTPLATIRAAAGSLADPQVELSEDVRHASARTIDEEADRLDRLVGNLLDMSRIQGGALKPDLEEIPLSEVLTPVLERLRPALAGREVTVELAADLPPVEVDAVFIDQVMTNLVDNAIKYAPVPAPLRLTAHADPAGERVLVVIEDGGRGVPDEALSHLFERFFRVKRPGEGSRRGTGLGLAVVQGLVEAMGGSVTADRSELGGLRMTLDLPSPRSLAAAARGS